MTHNKPKRPKLKISLHQRQQLQFTRTISVIMELLSPSSHLDLKNIDPSCTLNDDIHRLANTKNLTSLTTLQSGSGALSSSNKTAHGQLRKSSNVRANDWNSDRKISDKLQTALDRATEAEKNLESANQCAIFWKKQADHMVCFDMLFLCLRYRKFGCFVDV